MDTKVRERQLEEEREEGIWKMGEFLRIVEFVSRTFGFTACIVGAIGNLNRQKDTL